MGIEIPSEHGGAESSFTSAILTIEELAKIDPSVSVMCDVHNTLVNTVVRKYGTKEQHEKYLPLLAQSKVSLVYNCNHVGADFVWYSSDHSVCRKLRPGPTPSRYRRRRKMMGIIGS